MVVFIAEALHHVPISDRGQIVIPKGARDLFGITGGIVLILIGIKILAEHMGWI